jgi:hypothetical protein
MRTHRYNQIVGLAAILALLLAGCIAPSTTLPPTSTKAPALATNTAIPPTDTALPPTSTAQPPTDTAPASATPLPSTQTPPAGATAIPTAATCAPTDQDLYVYNPGRLRVMAACLHVTGVVAAVRNEADGDLHILLHLDPEFANLLRPANQGEELGDLVIEPVCVKAVTQADAVAACASDHDPFAGPLPSVGQHMWMEGRYVLDLEHGSWSELHPLYRWGPEGASAVNTAPVPNATLTPRPPVQLTSTQAQVIRPTETQGARVRVGALCVDGTSSTATGSGACSHHGGVKCWKYSDGTCTKP